MKLVYYCIAVILSLSACATTGATTETPTSGPKETAVAVIEALRAQDWDGVSTRLSQRRRADMNDSWFTMWQAEIQQAKDLTVQDVRIEPDGLHARVRVAFVMDGKTRETEVRLVKEADAWKWDER